MSSAVEDINRRMLRARDAMDRTYAEPLDIPGLDDLERHLDAMTGDDGGARDARNP